MANNSKVGVVGAGTMGQGIAQVAIQAGFKTHLVDIDEQALNRGRENITGRLERLVTKGRLSEEEQRAALDRLVVASSLDHLAACDLVIEAVVERYDIKADVLAQLDRVCRAQTILASNTSSISITKLAAVTSRPEQVIGMHFMNPVPVMKLVEIIRGLTTSQATFDVVESVSKEMGKIPVEIHDSPGFVSNRVLLPMINEAIFCLHEGVGTATSIDEVMKLGMAHPMGPLALADLIGLDICLDILRVLQEGFGDSKYRPCPLLVKMVDAGHLGRKSGRGFYEYGGNAGS